MWNTYGQTIYHDRGNLPKFFLRNRLRGATEIGHSNIFRTNSSASQVESQISPQTTHGVLFFLWLVCFPSFNSSIYRSLQNTSFWICLGVATQYIYIYTHIYIYVYNMYISMGLSNKPQKMAILGPWNHGEFSLAAMAVGGFHSGATPLSLDVWEWKFPLEWMISY